MVAQTAVFRERLAHDLLKFGGNVGIHGPKAWNFTFFNFTQSIDFVASGKQAFVGEKFPEDNPQRKNIGAQIQRLTAGLFGAHVAKLAFECSRAGTFKFTFGLSNTKIDDFDLTFEAQHNILWTDITVSDVQGPPGGTVQTAMSMIESCGDFLDDVGNLLDGEGALGLFHLIEDLTNIAPLNVIHDQKKLVSFDAEFIDGDDIAMIQVDSDLRLVFKHVNEFALIKILWENALDGDKFRNALGTLGLGEIHLGHPTGGELFKEDIFSKRLVLF